MSRRRLSKNRTLPRGLHCHNGYYSFVDPRTGQEYGLGRDRQKAIIEAREANAHLSGRRSSITLLSKDELLSRAFCRDYTLCGIYVLFLADRVMYVGQSTNVQIRLATHAAAGEIPFDRYAFIACDASRLDQTEAAYIAALRPEKNVVLQIKNLHSEEA